MTDPVQLLIDAGAIPATPFVTQSRYSGVSLAVYERRSGEPGIVYVRRRFIASPGRSPVYASHVVMALDRPDTLAAAWFGDPLLYWRIADANAVVDPHELSDTLGRRVIIPLPAGT